MMVEIRQRADYKIRPMQERDIPQTLEIDREAFPSQWPYPTYSSFKQELNNRLAHYIVAYKAIEELPDSFQDSNPANNKKFVHKIFNIMNIFNPSPNINSPMLPPGRDYLIGMAGFWLMAGEVHIITIAVRNSFKNQGIGARMLIHVIDSAIALNASVVTLEVRVSNTVAQRLYRAYGFKPAGIRHKYYTDNNENALIMTTDNINQPDFSSRFQYLKETHMKKCGDIRLS
jgi:ribosomal-protein-alanine N-acetyltransferase